MASEKIIQSGFRYPIVIAFVFLLTVAGILFEQAKYLQSAIFFISGLFTVFLLIRLYDITNQALAGFFNALRNNDTSEQFPVGIKNRSLSRLYASMNNVNRHFQEIKMQNEYNENYYKTLIKHANSGLLVLNGNNQVALINQSACKFAGISADSTNPNLLKIKNPMFYEAICKLQPGEDITYKHVLGNEYQLLSFRASLLRKNNDTLKLISIHDIRHEMEAKELESYRKLISVLTHEIMNLMSPITSVSKSLASMYQSGGQDINLTDVDESMLKTTLKGIRLIDEQSKGMTAFIENYRKISRIPQPVAQTFGADEWIEQLRIVYTDRMKENQIQFLIAKDNQLKTISGDKSLLNQVMINLLNNAIDAVSEVDYERKI